MKDFAVFALTGMIAIGIVSIIGLYLTIKKSSLANAIAILILMVSIVSFGLAARTGYLGGQIRHTEVGSAPSGQDSSDENRG